MEIRTLRYFLAVAREALCCQLTLDGLVDTSPESGLVFRPLTPRLETKLFLI